MNATFIVIICIHLFTDSGASKNAKYGNSNSSRRQKLKTQGSRRFGGEAVYFRAEDQNTSPTGEVGTSPTDQAGTSPTGEAGTTPVGGVGTSPTGEAGTSPTGEEGKLTNTQETAEGSHTGTETGQGLQTREPIPPGHTGETGAEIAKNQENATTSVTQQVNYHYHFHYFGAAPPPTVPAEAPTTRAINT